MRQKPLIATKCGLLWNNRREKINCLKKDSIENECNASLKRLGVDVIDLYQIHHPTPDEDITQAWEQMAKLREQGKVRYLGVSNFSVEQMERLQKVHPVASLQPIYNMLHREVEDRLLGCCQKNNIGIVAYSPMQRGLLTGKFSSERLANLAPDDYRRQNLEFQEPRFSLILELVEELKKIAERNSRPLSQLAIGWVLRRPEITSAIVGARSPRQITEAAPAGDYKLSDEDIDEIESLLARYNAKLNAKLKQ
jgi:aryl-alcohol dehydrogenase-like predicted oxidoreductase